MRAFRALVVFVTLLVLTTAVTLAGPPYRYVRSTGPFMIPPDAASVDWVLVNSSGSDQRYRVSVYRLPVGGPKVLLAPGTLDGVLPPDHTTHNANSVGTIFLQGFPHEIIVESDSLDVLPMAVSWSGFSGAASIVESQIVAEDWVLLKGR